MKIKTLPRQSIKGNKNWRKKSSPCKNYSLNGKKLVENKVKANEGKKKITKKLLVDLDLSKDLTIVKFKETCNLKRNYLSQTEYYYLRDKCKITDRITEVLRKCAIELKTTKYSWSYVTKKNTACPRCFKD